MMTKQFWADAAERAVKTFAQALLAALTVQGATLASVKWLPVLAVAGTATAISLLTSVLSYSATGTASLVEDTPGRHAAPEESSSPDPEVTA